MEPKTHWGDDGRQTYSVPDICNMVRQCLYPAPRLDWLHGGLEQWDLYPAPHINAERRYSCMAGLYIFGAENILGKRWPSNIFGDGYTQNDTYFYIPGTEIKLVA